VGQEICRPRAQVDLESMVAGTSQDDYGPTTGAKVDRRNGSIIEG
jgi:hypothetical protein